VLMSTRLYSSAAKLVLYLRLSNKVLRKLMSKYMCDSRRPTPTFPDPSLLNKDSRTFRTKSASAIPWRATGSACSLPVKNCTPVKLTSSHKTRPPIFNSYPPHPQVSSSLARNSATTRCTSFKESVPTMTILFAARCIQLALQSPSNRER
jgi:hypothetical protein